MRKLKIISIGLLTMSAISCVDRSSPSANTVSNTVNSANTNTVANKPAADMLMTSVPKLLEMVERDATGVTEQFKGRDMTVIGEVDDVMTELRFVAGLGRKVYCTLGSGELDEKKQKIRTLAEAYQMKRRQTMPIVEVRGVFKSGSVAQVTTPYKGTEVSAFLESCTIVSVKE